MSANLRELVKPSRRSCGMAIHLRNRKDSQKHIIVGALCGSWKCPTCGVYLRRKWLEHLAGKWSGVLPLYVSLVSKDRWPSLAVRIRRSGCQFATVEQDSGMLTVFTSLNCGEPVTSILALSMLENVLRSVNAVHRPVHTSRGWGLLKDAPKVAEWERVEKLPITVEQAEDAVVKAGITISRFWNDHQRGFYVNVPDSYISDFGKLLGSLCSLSRSGADV